MSALPSRNPIVTVTYRWRCASCETTARVVLFVDVGSVVPEPRLVTGWRMVQALPLCGECAPGRVVTP